MYSALTKQFTVGIVFAYSYVLLNDYSLLPHFNRVKPA